DTKRRSDLIVILSAAKDLKPVASGDEVLRYAQDDGSYSHLPIALARSASGIFSIAGTLNTPDATRTISPPHTRSQLQKQKLMVRRAMRAVPSSHWPSLAPRTNSELSDTVGCGQRMPVAWPEPTPITMSATVT